MWTWPVWVWCVIGSAIVIALYLFWQLMLHFSHWLGRGNKPGDRVWAFVVICAVVGAGGGGLGSALLDDLRPCHDSGKPLAACFLPSGV